MADKPGFLENLAMLAGMYFQNMPGPGQRGFGAGLEGVSQIGAANRERQMRKMQAEALAKQYPQLAPIISMGGFNDPKAMSGLAQGIMKEQASEKDLEQRAGLFEQSLPESVTPEARKRLKDYFKATGQAPTGKGLEMFGLGSEGGYTPSRPLQDTLADVTGHGPPWTNAEITQARKAQQSEKDQDEIRRRVGTAQALMPLLGPQETAKGRGKLLGNNSQLYFDPVTMQNPSSDTTVGNTEGLIKIAPAELQGIQQIQTSLAGVQRLKDLVSKVLVPSTGDPIKDRIATTKQAADLWLRSRTDPDVREFFAARDVTMIPDTRAVAGIARINQKELSKLETARIGPNDTKESAMASLNFLEKFFKDTLKRRGFKPGKMTEIAPAGDQSAAGNSEGEITGLMKKFGWSREKAEAVHQALQQEGSSGAE